MPSSPSRFIPRGLTVTELRKFIPYSWKQLPRPIQETPKTLDESLPDAFRRFIAKGHLYEAFRTFSLLCDHCSLAGSSHKFVLHSASSLLSTCVEFNEFVPGLQIHARCIMLGMEFDPVLVRKLVTFYSAFNLLDEARTITESSDTLHTFSWNVLIDSYVRNRRFEEAVSAYKRMVSKGIQPDAFIYPSVLKACGALHDFTSGIVVHASIEVSSHRCNLFVCNALISMYRRLGKVDIARKLFDRMSERDAVSWNAVIDCYASEGNMEEAFELLHRMHCSGVEFTVVTWNIIAGGCLQIGKYGEALKIISKMRDYNVSLDLVAMSNGLKACSHVGAIHWGKEFHCLAICSGYSQVDVVQNSLITMYSRCNDLWHAFIVFQQIEAKSLSTWNSIISGCAHNERSEEAFFLLKEMLLAGFHPNYVTLASILALCAWVSNLQHGKEVHGYILRRQNFNECLILSNSLVDMYAKSANIIAAKRVFESMSKRDKVSYTSLINGYGMLGKGEVALACFKDMIRSGISPDHVTIVAVLSACSHSNLVSDGKNVFEKMQNAFSVLPRLEHFSCMVDLYCRVGFLGQARDVICKTPCEPSSDMFATLLLACLDHGNTCIGEWAADKLLEMKSGNRGHYSLIAKMYTVTGSSNLAEVEILISELDVQKAHEFDLVETESEVNRLRKPMIDTVCSSATNHEQSSDEERLVEVG